MSEQFLCVVPARGGSKRLPRKNILEIGGKPMISYSIQAALEADLFDRVYVATDDETIASTAREYGAVVPELMPESLCGDQVPSHQPAQHLAKKLADEGNKYDTLVLLQPTSPLRVPADIEDGVETFRSDDYDFVVSVSHIDPHYFHWAMEANEDDYWRMHFGDQYLKERPKLPDKFRPTGSVKIANLQALQREGHFFASKCGAFEVPRRRSVHVGTKFEFDVADSLLERRDGMWE
jgi:CMP-N-acetylneuraminic acid synthetase